MITITRSINKESRSVTFTFDETPAETSIKGRMCHSVDDSIVDPFFISLMEYMGYELVDVGLLDDEFSVGKTIIQYWARQEGE